MKLSVISPIVAIVTTIATSLTIGITSIEAAAIPAEKVSAPGQLIAKVGTPLAKQLQGKPVVVDIYASWCPGCKNIAPTLSQLKQRYGDKMHFVVFDVSDSKKTKASMKMAAKLGLTDFFNANKSKTSTVAIIDPATGKVTKQFQNNPELAEYTTVIDRSIAQMGHSGMMKPGDAMGHGDAMMKK
jgi:thiol-disulfide isomerase/thioredoxin